MYTQPHTYTTTTIHNDTHIYTYTHLHTYIHTQIYIIYLYQSYWVQIFKRGNKIQRGLKLNEKN